MTQHLLLKKKLSIGQNSLNFYTTSANIFTIWTNHVAYYARFAFQIFARKVLLNYPNVFASQHAADLLRVLKGLPKKQLYSVYLAYQIRVFNMSAQTNSLDLLNTITEHFSCQNMYTGWPPKLNHWNVAIVLHTQRSSREYTGSSIWQLFDRFSFMNTNLFLSVILKSSLYRMNH